MEEIFPCVLVIGFPYREKKLCDWLRKGKYERQTFRNPWLMLTPVILDNMTKTDVVSYHYTDRMFCLLTILLLTLKQNIPKTTQNCKIYLYSYKAARQWRTP